MIDEKLLTAIGGAVAGAISSPLVAKAFTWFVSRSDRQDSELMSYRHELIGDNRRLHDKILEVVTQLADANSEIRELTERILAMQSQIVSLKESNSALLAELESVKQSNEELRAEVKALRTRLEAQGA